jgi:hypothetical protein
MEAACSSETLGDFHRRIRRCIPEDGVLQIWVTGRCKQRQRQRQNRPPDRRKRLRICCQFGCLKAAILRKTFRNVTRKIIREEEGSADKRDGKIENCGDRGEIKRREFISICPARCSNGVSSSRSGHNILSPHPFFRDGGGGDGVCMGITVTATAAVTAFSCVLRRLKHTLLALKWLPSSLMSSPGLMGPGTMEPLVVHPPQTPCTQIRGYATRCVDTEMIRSAGKQNWRLSSVTCVTLAEILVLPTYAHGEYKTQPWPVNAVFWDAFRTVSIIDVFWEFVPSGCS